MSAARDIVIRVQPGTTYMPDRPGAKFKLTEFNRTKADYERRHPQVRIDLISLPGTGWEWLVTQLSGGLAPDIVAADCGICNMYSDQDWFIDLVGYLEQPNPYDLSRARWGDFFYEAVLDASRDSDGALYALSIDAATSGFYFNKTLFNELELKPPTTWKQFMAVQQRLQDAGYVACAVPMSPSGGGAGDNYITSMLLTPYLDQIDLQGDRPGELDCQELVSAYRRRLWGPQAPYWRESMRLLRQWSQFWQVGFLAGTRDTIYTMFVRQEAAMMYDGCWRTAELNRDSRRQFDFGVFAFPAIDAESSSLAQGVLPRDTARPSAVQYAITSLAFQRGVGEWAVDFLRFLTAPAQAGPLIAEAGKLVPNVKGCQVDPAMRPWREFLDRKGAWLHVPVSELLGLGFNDKRSRCIEEFLGGVASLEETAGKLDGFCAQRVNELLAEHEGIWHFGHEFRSAVSPGTPRDSEVGR